MFTNLMKEINVGKTQMTLLAFVMIFGLLLLIYRNAVKALTPVIPIMMIVGWNGLVMYMLGIDYTPITATLGSLTIGVASEYTILIMERYLRGEGKWPDSPRFGSAGNGQSGLPSPHIRADNRFWLCGTDRLYPST